MVYLSCMITFARFSGEIWDGIFSTASSDRSVKTEAITVLDARIKLWEDTILPGVQLPSSAPRADKHQVWQRLLVTTVCYGLEMTCRPID